MTYNNTEDLTGCEDYQQSTASYLASKMAQHIDNSVLLAYTSPSTGTWTTTTTSHSISAATTTNPYPNFYNIHSKLTRNKITKTDIFIVHDLDVPTKETKIPQTASNLREYHFAGFSITQIRYDKECSRLEYRIVSNVKSTVNSNLTFKDDLQKLKLPNKSEYINSEFIKLPFAYQFLSDGDNFSLSNISQYYSDMFFDFDAPEELPEIFYTLDAIRKNTRPNPTVLLPEYSYITIKPMAELKDVPNISFRDIEDLLYYICPFRAEIIPDLANAMRYSANLQSDVTNADSYIIKSLTTLILNNCYY